MPLSTESASRFADSTRFTRLRRRIIAVGVLLILAFAASSAYDAWRSYLQAVRENHRELGNLAKALAEQGARSLQTIDLLLRDTAQWYAGRGRTLAPEVVNEVLAARAAGLAQVRAVRIIDAQGVRRFQSRPLLADTANASDRSYFIAHRDGTATGLFISEPILARSENRVTFFLSRRLDDQGTFAGIVNATVDLEDVRQFYRAIDLGSGSAIHLLRDDGTLIVRDPEVLDAVGKKFPELAAAAGEPARVVLSTVDSVPRFVAVAHMRDLPLVVAVTRKQAVALQPWRDDAIPLAVRTLVFTLLVTLALVALLHQLRLIEAGEQALRESEARLRQSQKLEAMGTLAGGIAHDFNNILGAILGYGELAHKHSTEGSAARRYLDNVMQATERAKALVERILGFSRSGVSERAPVNVQAVVEETLELLSASLPPRVRIVSKLESGTAAVLGDATQLHQVVMNLCTNALQAMKDGGTLGVVLERVDLRDGRSFSHGSLAPGQYVRLSVSDTGTGIPPAVLARMFDPFFTTKSVGEGTGLGLSLVHGIVADMGGAIDVSTAVGAGTRFAIWLPVTAETAKPAGEAARELPRGHGETVMIVDDERALVALAEETLAELGYEPVGYDSSVAALQAFRADPQRFDLVLTDETMPELIGTELAREIRRLRPDVPVVLMSGYAGAQLAERAGAAGITEVLRKPLVSGDIAESLGRVLGSAR